MARSLPDSYYSCCSILVAVNFRETNVARGTFLAIHEKVQKEFRPHFVGLQLHLIRKKLFFHLNFVELFILMTQIYQRLCLAWCLGRQLEF